MSEKYRVLIVDDSTVFRSQIRWALESVPEIEIVGYAANGRLAVDALKNKPVDLVTLDLEMPEMNGLETLKELNRLNIKVKTIVFSSLTKAGAEATLSALALGASDFLTKPNLAGSQNTSPAEVIRSLLVPKILQFCGRTPVSVPSQFNIPGPAPQASSVPTGFKWDLFIPKVVVIASSTGGPQALEKLFKCITGPFQCPILIVQHMPPIFTAFLADHIARLTGLPIKEAVHLEPVQKQIYIAPGNFHMRIGNVGGSPKILLDQSEQRGSVRPAADNLFESAAGEYRAHCLGVVMTGMGADGRDGALAIKREHGAVIIQDKETSVVFGMPGAIFDLNAYDYMGPIESIANKLAHLGVCRLKSS